MRKTKLLFANFNPISALDFVNYMCEIMVPKMSFYVLKNLYMKIHVQVCVYIYLHKYIYKLSQI